MLQVFFKTLDPVWQRSAYFIEKNWEREDKYSSIEYKLTLFQKCSCDPEKEWMRLLQFVLMNPARGSGSELCCVLVWWELVQLQGHHKTFCPFLHLLQKPIKFLLCVHAIRNTVFSLLLLLPAVWASGERITIIVFPPLSSWRISNFAFCK